MYKIMSSKRVRGNRVEVKKKVRKSGFKGNVKHQLFMASKAFIGLIALLFSHTAASVDFEWSSLGVADGNNIANPSVTGTGSTLVMNVATVLVIDGVERPLTDIDAAGQITDADGTIDTIDFDTINNGPFSYETSPSGGISNYLHMEIEHDTCEANDKLIVRLTFENGAGDGVGVRDLGFALTDVDQSDFDDAVQVFADGVNVRDILPSVVTVGANSEENNVVGLEGWDGVSNTGNGSAAANITFDFPATYTVSELEIRYSSNEPCDSGQAPSNQKIGLTTVAIADTTTPATVTRFSSEQLGSSVVFDWETSNEVGHLGFQLYARGESDWVLLNDDLIFHHTSGGDAMGVKSYQYRANNVEGEWFTLIDVSTTEELTPHGPYKLGKSYGDSLAEVSEVDWRDIRLGLKQASKPKALLSKRLNRLRKLASEGGEQ